MVKEPDYKAEKALNRNLTKLHHACWLGNKDDVIRYLKSTSVNVKDDEQRTPLHLAAAKGHTEIVQLLMENYSDLNFNEKDKTGKTPLMKAIEGHHVETVKQMITNGANTNETDIQGNTSLHIALSFGHYDIVHYILRYLPNCNLKNADGITPLHIVAETKQTKVARKLFEHGANVNTTDIKGRTPLMLACKKSFFPMISLLLKYKADLSQKDCNGWTALDYASIMGNTQLSNMLDGYIKTGLYEFSETESESSDEEEEWRTRVQKSLSSRVVPLKFKREATHERYYNTNKEDEEKKKDYKKPDGIHDDEGNLLPVPDIVIAMQSSANKLNDIQEWIAHQKSVTEEKEKQRDELKIHVKRLLDERQELLSKKENLKNRISEMRNISDALPNIEQSQILNNELLILREGLEELKKEHERVIKERNGLKLIMEEDRKVHQNSDSALEDKVEQLRRDNQMLYEKLNELQSETHEVIDELNKKCEKADELVEHLKILLRGTYKLLEEKQSDVNKMIQEINAQQELVGTAKDRYNALKDDNSQVGKHLEQLGSKMTDVKKNINKLQIQMERHSLMKKLIDAGVIDSNMKKSPSQESISDKSSICAKFRRKKLSEVDTDTDMKMFSEHPYDPTGLMSPIINAPTVCQTTVESVRYSWLDDQSANILSEDINLLTGTAKHHPLAKECPPIITPRKSSCYEAEPSKDDTLPPHLQAKLACLTAKYSQ